MKQADTFLKTKVHFPFSRRDLVARPRLLARVAGGISGPFTLVVAPAGFGKTTLLVSAIAESGMPAAWLSLDKGDNPVERFLGYLLLAFQQVDLALGQAAGEILESSQQVQPEVVLTGLVNDLVAFQRDIILVLDDFQTITSQGVHEAVRFLLDHCPTTLHVAVASRSDPPVPVTRLRARGQVVELRAADLRFSAEEAALFLNEQMGLGLDEQAVLVLEERTEGWIAGLQMAALSMRDRKDVSAFIRAFSGTNRYILDYLLEEVLANQPSETQRFLLYTSILDRMCAPLCDALVASDTGKWQAGAQSMLAGLEISNLFLVSLDDEGKWYRYHHLFGDLLQARLDHLYPGLKPELHRRAAGWLEQQGIVVDAVNQALAGGEHDQAARLVEENTALLLARGELQALMTWVAVLPNELRGARPWLCIHQAYALAFAGRIAEAEQLLRQVERMDSKADPVLQGCTAAVRSMTACMAGRELEAIQQASRARELLPPERAWDRAAAAWGLGYAQRSQGRLAEARAAFEEMVELARSMGNLWTLVSGLMDLASTVRSQGQLGGARLLFEEALREAGSQGARNLGYIARIETGLASVLFEQNQLEECQRLISAALEHVSRWQNPNHLVYAFVVQARLLLAQKDPAGAREAVLKADQVRRQAPLSSITRCMVETGLVRVWLALDKVAGAPGDILGPACVQLIKTWRESLLEPGITSLDECASASALMLARVLLMEGQAQAALDLLGRVRHTAESMGNAALMLDATLVTAAILRVGPQPDEKAALLALEAAMALAQTGGFVRAFLDLDLQEGEHPVQALLEVWLSRAGAHPLRDYALYLKKLLDVEYPRSHAEDTGKPVDQGLVEALSRREIEVLRLLAEGLTNDAISRTLVISAGTVKAHTAAIYRKLDAGNRTEAVAHARKHGILP